jgi:hypothetical protein
MGKPGKRERETDIYIYPISRGCALPPVSRATNSALREASFG